MPICDICSRPLDASEMETVPGSQIVLATANGFQPSIWYDDSLELDAVSDKVVWLAIVQKHATNPWGLCAGCHSSVKRHLPRAAWAAWKWSELFELESRSNAVTVPCPLCGALLDEKAKHCHQCGATEPGYLFKQFVIAGILMAAGLGGLWFAEAVGWRIASYVLLGLGVFVIVVILDALLRASWKPCRNCEQPGADSYCRVCGAIRWGIAVRDFLIGSALVELGAVGLFLSEARGWRIASYVALGLGILRMIVHAVDVFMARSISSKRKTAEAPEEKNAALEQSKETAEPAPGTAGGEIIQVSCAQCGKSLKAKRGSAGKRFKCSACRAAQAAPPEPERKDTSFGLQGEAAAGAGGPLPPVSIPSPRTLRCRNCSKEYRIGVDSAITTSDELSEAFSRGGSTAIRISNANMPDTIGDCNYQRLPTAQVKDIREKNEQALRKVDADPGRVWRCNKCGNKQSYADKEREPEKQVLQPSSQVGTAKQTKAADSASIRISCAQCKKQLTVKAALGGKRIRCPACGAVQAAGPQPEIEDSAFGLQAAAVAGASPPGTALPGMNDPSWKVRCSALKRLGKAKTPEAIEALVAALDDRHFQVQAEAAKGLAHRGDPRGLARRSELMNFGSFFDHDEFRWIREAARDALGAVKTSKACDMLAQACSRRLDVVAAKALWRAGDPRGKDHLLGYLDCSAAVEALGELGASEAVGALITALKDAHGDVRAEAAKALGQIGDEAAIRPMKALLKDEDFNVRRAALAALARLGDAGSVRQLRRNFKQDSKSKTFYSDAAVALGKIDDRAVLDCLKDQLFGSDNSDNAVAMLGEIGSSATLEMLYAARKHPDLDTRACTLEILTHKNVPGAVDELAAILEEPACSRRIRESIGKVLAQRGDPRARWPLIYAMREANGGDKYALINKLGQLGDPRATNEFLKLLQFGESEDRTREVAACALGCLGDPQAVKPLIAAVVGKKDWGLRAAAAFALAMIGDASATEALQQATQDVAPSVREAAEHALQLLARKAGRTSAAPSLASRAVIGRISKARFHAMTRNSKVLRDSEEKAWFGTQNGDVVATLVLDKECRWLGIIWVRDENGGFPGGEVFGYGCSAGAPRVTTEPEACELLVAKMAILARPPLPSGVDGRVGDDRESQRQP